MSELRSGRFRGYSVRRARPPLLVCVQIRCDLCGCNFTDGDVQAFWVKTRGWMSKLSPCPECGFVVEFVAGFIPSEAAA